MNVFGSKFFHLKYLQIRSEQSFSLKELICTKRYKLLGGNFHCPVGVLKNILLENKNLYSTEKLFNGRDLHRIKNFLIKSVTQKLSKRLSVISCSRSSPSNSER